MKTAGISLQGPPAGLVRRDSPAMRQVRESIARFGYAHTEPGAVSGAEVSAAGLHVRRGLCIDTFWRDRVALRGDENLEELRRLGERQKQNER